MKRNRIRTESRTASASSRQRWERERIKKPMVFNQIEILSLYWLFWIGLEELRLIVVWLRHGRLRLRPILCQLPHLNSHSVVVVRQVMNVYCLHCAKRFSSDIIQKKCARDPLWLERLIDRQKAKSEQSRKNDRYIYKYKIKTNHNVKIVFRATRIDVICLQFNPYRFRLCPADTFSTRNCFTSISFILSLMLL